MPNIGSSDITHQTSGKSKIDYPLNHHPCNFNKIPNLQAGKATCVSAGATIVWTRGSFYYDTYYQYWCLEIRLDRINTHTWYRYSHIPTYY